MIRRSRRSNAGSTWGIALAVCPMLAGAPLLRAETPVDRFLSGIEQNANLPADAKQLIRSTWADCKDCDPGEFLVQGLSVLSEPFRKGLDAYDAAEYGDCVSILDPLRTSKDPFVAVHASVYEIKALVAEERLLEASKLIDQLLDGRPVEASPVAFNSYMSAEVTFLQGFCQLADLEYDRAEKTLRHFLEYYPDATPRLNIAAQQMLAELQTRQPEKIGEVCDLMNFSGRRLNVGDSGEIVQTRQSRVIELLDKLIKEAEDKESNSSSSSSGGSQGSQPKGGQRPTSPMQDSQLPGGEAQRGSLRAQRRANPGDMWGSMPPAERERILQALRDNFPSRYRRLVEQYYEELAKKP